jgi:hypothetical protein
MYAAFLREAATRLDNRALGDASAAMTEAGDTWRMFALRASKMCKGREPMDTALLADVIRQCADREALAWELSRRPAASR